MVIALNPTGTPAAPLGTFGALPTAVAATPQVATPTVAAAPTAQHGPPARAAFNFPFTGGAGLGPAQFGFRQPMTTAGARGDGSNIFTPGHGPGPAAPLGPGINPGGPMIPGGGVTPPPGTAGPL